MTTALSPSAESVSVSRLTVGVFLFRLRAFIALLILIGIFTLLTPSFFTPENLIILVGQTAINAIMAVGMTFVILTGGIDLSVGSTVGLAAMVSGLLIDRGLELPMFGIVVFFNVPAIIVLVLCLGILVGAFNGILVTRFNVAPFIATLGTLYVARGLAQLSNEGATFPNLVGNPELGNTGFPILGAGTILGIPIVIWIMIIFTGLGWFVAGKTPFGRQVYAVGGNERAAELSGIYVRRIKMAVYMICGMCAAMTGLVTASQLVAAHPATGESYELNAIAAVVLGGTSLAGGRGTVWGTMIGALVIGVLTNGLVLLGVQEFWKKVITGLVIILAVVLDQLQARLQQRLALKRG
ncbi:MAG TPA: ABC transporter permease [Chthoniobacterales bacterium]|nr:ABC transporter permease [Chthoniobacterales bacterium]